MSVQFSGGEPTMSPLLPRRRPVLEEGRLQQRAGGDQRDRVRQEPRVSPRQAADAGLRYAYLQFDGIGNAANSHRLVGNLFDVKLQAIENLHKAGVDIVPVITILNGINNEQVGRVVQFALDNPRKISFLSFQPVSFTGRDEEITDERRARAALHAVAPGARREGSDRDRRAGSRLVPDLLHGDLHRLGRPGARAAATDWGQLNCGCHPNCGVGMAVMIDKETKEAVPFTAFVKGERLAKDIASESTTRREGTRLVGGGHGARPDAQLRPVQGADPLQARSTC